MMTESATMASKNKAFDWRLQQPHISYMKEKKNVLAYQTLLCRRRVVQEMKVDS